MFGITALFTALLSWQRAFQLTKCVDYHQSLNNTPVLSRPICPQSGDNRESLISFPHSPSIHILKPDTISQRAALFIMLPPGSGALIRKDVRCVQYCQFPDLWFARISRKTFTPLRYTWLCVCELHILLARLGEDIEFYDAWRWLCSSVLVLAEDSWCAAAFGLHLLCSIAPADFLGPERNRSDSGEPDCQVHFNLSLQNRGWKNT